MSHLHQQDKRHNDGLLDTSKQERTAEKELSSILHFLLRDMEQLESLGEIYYDILNFSNMNVMIRSPKSGVHWRRGFFYFLLCFAISSVGLLTYSSLVATSDFYIYTYNVCNWIQQLQLVIKIFYFQYRSSSLDMISLRFETFASCRIMTDKAVSVLTERVDNIKRMNKIYYLATWSTCLLFAGFPLFQIFFWVNKDPYVKILTTVYPFEINYSPIYEMVYFYEFVECITISVLLPAVDIFFCSAGYLLCTQMMLVQKSIVLTLGNENSAEGLRGISIRMFIEDHTVLLKMCNNLRDMVSPLLMLQLLVSVTTFSFVIYRITQVDREEDTLLYFANGAKTAMYFVTTFIQFAPYCWISDQLQKANEEVCFAAYSTNWYNRDSDFKRSIQMTQIQSTRDMSLNAMKMLKVNLNTIVDILKLSYSYYTLLSQISKE